MTEQQYNQTWNDLFQPFTEIQIPSHWEYLLREGMVEDYLDIFRGENTRVERQFANLPYDHPFFDSNGKAKLPSKPCIRYILFGEAAPVLNTTIPVNSCTPIPGDKGNSYFYDIRHVKQTNWIASPRLNWNCPDYKPCPTNKIGCLLCLASRGVLLLDLFPYAIPFSTKFRYKLNQNGITASFWNNQNVPYSIQNRINNISSLLCPDWDLSFIAPYVTSEYIINPNNNLSHIATQPIGIHPKTFRLRNNSPTRFAGSKWRKLAISNGRTPSALLINASF